MQESHRKWNLKAVLGSLRENLQSKCDQLDNFTVDSESLSSFLIINWCWTAARKLQFNVIELSWKIHLFLNSSHITVFQALTLKT